MMHGSPLNPQFLVRIPPLFDQIPSIQPSGKHEAQSRRETTNQGEDGFTRTGFKRAICMSTHCTGYVIEYRLRKCCLPSPIASISSAAPQGLFSDNHQLMGCQPDPRIHCVLVGDARRTSLSPFRGTGELLHFGGALRVLAKS
ncbi:hypothetical protein AB1N83_006521 [Pleurotus pulmonarius]